MYDEVSAAVDDKSLSDATGRNALYKIHVSLGKIVNGFTEKASKGRKSSVPVEDTTSMISTGRPEEKVEGAETDDDEGTVLHHPPPRSRKSGRHSTVESSIVEDEEEGSDQVKVEEEEDLTIVPKSEPVETDHERDSLVESLLSDDDDGGDGGDVEMSGM